LPLVVAKSKRDSKKFHLLHPIKEEESCVSEKCHAQAKKVKYVHAPVATGVCVVCHGKIRTNPPYGLTRTGTDLCLGCHEQQKAFFGQARFVHKPVKEGCTNCHNPHSSQINKFFLAQSELTVCTNCHRSEKADPNKIPQIIETKFSHKPVSEGKCAGCHAPHASNFKRLLREGPQEVALCFSCHKKKAGQVKAAEFKHGPIRDGMCASCHKPHGSEIPKNLKHNFVEKFYNSYDPELYELCFKCHKDTLVKDERTTYLTNFRNGDRNLHYLHVNRKKGRTCIACHEVHMGSQAMQIRNLTPFGGWQLPIKYAKTTSGGKCLESCHILKQYDRENPVKLDIDSEQVSVANK
jgi:predicted CXXCH cytochrome family protein